jgi:hypothetical protein
MRPSVNSAGNGATGESPSQLGVAMAPFQLYLPFLGNDNGHFAAALSVVRGLKCVSEE